MNLPMERRLSHILFPLRHVAYTDRAQTSPTHPDYQSLAEPTEPERIFVQNLERIIRGYGGRLDPSKLEWSFMENTHPDYGCPMVSRLSCVPDRRAQTIDICVGMS